MGFTFDDGDTKQVATTLSEMRRLIAKDPRNSQRIFPYIGGEEVIESPTHQHHRFVIKFGEMAEEDARQWPDLFGIVTEKVLPERTASTAKSSSGKITEKFWQFGHTAKSLYDSIAGLGKTLVCLRVSPTLAFTFLRTDAVFANTLNVFADARLSNFAVLQGRCHEFWARWLSSTFGDTQAYHPSDCFETFPFPAGFETNAALEAAGREYYEFRAALMQDLWLGLTEIYNLFHSPDDEALARLEALYRKRAATPDWRTAESVPADRSPLTLYATPAAALAGVRRLRELHAAMDIAVLTAYGWTDLLPKCTCEFLLDYEDDDSESATEESSGRKKKKPWRYRWPDEVRDEVLARLLKENAKRAEEERIHGLGDSGNGGSSSKKPGRPKKPQPSNDAPTLDL